MAPPKIPFRPCWMVLFRLTPTDISLPLYIFVTFVYHLCVMRQMLVGQDFVCMILKTEKYCFMHFDISSNSIKKYEEIGWSSIRIAWPTGSINKTSLHNTSSFWICWKNWFAQLLALMSCFFCLFGFYFYRGHSHSFPFIGCLDHESYDCCC